MAVQNPEELTLKVLILGNSGTGKTAFLTRYFNSDKFVPQFIPTVGIDFSVSTLERLAICSHF